MKIKPFCYKRTFVSLSLFAILTSSLNSYANYDLPNGCEFGRTEAPINVQISNENIQDLINVSHEDTETQENSESWADLIEWVYDLIQNFDYLRIEGPAHVIKGENYTFKGNLFDPYVYVNFHTSEKGYVGRDKSNLEANAYRSFSYDNVHGYALAWITRDGYCSAKGVWVQNKPTITATLESETSNNRVSGTIDMNGYQDPNYSKNGLNNLPIQYHVQRKVISRWTGTRCDVVEESTSWENSGTYLRTNDKFTFNNLDCEVSYRMRSYDGKFFSIWTYQTARKTPSSSSSSSSGSGGGSTSSSGGGGSCTGFICDIEP